MSDERSNAAEGVAGGTLDAGFQRSDETDGLRDRAMKGGSSLLDKLAAFSDAEWDELTHRMTKHFGRELHTRGLTLSPTPEAAPDGLREALEWAAKDAHVGWLLWESDHPRGYGAPHAKEFSDCTVPACAGRLELVAAALAAAPRSLDVAWRADLDRLVAAWNAYREAQARRGHQGQHDDDLRPGCSACGGAQYGTEVELVDLFGALTAKLREPA